MDVVKPWGVSECVKNYGHSMPSQSMNLRDESPVVHGMDGIDPDANRISRGCRT